MKRHLIQQSNIEHIIILNKQEIRQAPYELYIVTKHNR